MGDDYGSYLNPKRTHDPSIPLPRPHSTRLTLWVAQIALVLGLFYYINEEFGGGFIDVLFYAQNPLQLRQFPLSFWLSVYFALIVSKFFKRSASVLGVVGGQLVVEYYHFN